MQIKAEVHKNLDGDWSICSKPHFGSEFFTCLRYVSFHRCFKIFFFNIVYQKISNMPLDAHKSTHIFEKQVISAANAVKFLFLLSCYLLT